MSSYDRVWSSLADKHTMVRDGDHVLEVLPDDCFGQNKKIIHHLYLGVVWNCHLFTSIHGGQETVYALKKL